MRKGALESPFVLNHEEPYAIFGDVVATELLEIARDPHQLDTSGWWAVTQDFEGEFRGYKFGCLSPLTDVHIESTPIHFTGVWTSSSEQQQYEAAVESIRSDIARGWVYQVNLCRILSRQLEADINPASIWNSVVRGNPAPYGGALYIPQNGIDASVRIASFSPELFISRNKNQLTSSPIKGTAPTKHELLEKDSAENIMIVDLVRNDFSHIAQRGTVSVPDLLRVESHPGLVHLVSDVSCEVSSDITWTQILKAMSPAGSVSGAPKISALKVIAGHESQRRGIYCGALGWVDATQKIAKLAVGIRTFWQETTFTDGVEAKTLKFGTGAGITWGSDPEREWYETELKAAKLFSLVEQLQ